MKEKKGKRRQKLLVGNLDPSVHISVVLSEGAGQCLQLNAQCNEVIKGDVTKKGKTGL